MSTPVTPWWEVLKLRDEIVHSSGSIDDVQMSLFQAVHGTAATVPPYADAAYYGEITHPSPLFTDLMAKVAVRLGGGDELHPRAGAVAAGPGDGRRQVARPHRPVAPCRPPRGARARRTSGSAGIRQGRQRSSMAPPAADLGNPQVVVLACDNMTAGQGRRRSTTDRRGRCTSGSCGGCSAATTRCTCGTSDFTATRTRSSRRSPPSGGRC